MPSFADLKAKAAKTTSSGVERLQKMKDQNTSVSIKNTNWDPYSGKPPPPPPPPKSLINTRTKPEPTFLPPPNRTNSTASSSSTSRTASNSPAPAPPLPVRKPSIGRPLPSRTPSSGPPLPSRTPSLGPPLPKRTGQPALSPPSRPSAGPPKPVAPFFGPPPPPPVVRSTKPVLEQRDSFYADTEDPQIDWTNLSQDDKEMFFSWLDEFFSNYLNITIAPKAIAGPTPTGHTSGPPPLKVTTKPTSWMSPVVGSTRDLILSHPPAAIHGSAAADLADYFKPATQWNEPWYHQSGIPPSLRGNTHIRYVSSWQSIGNTKTTRIGVLFSDLSVFWGAVTFAMDDPRNEKHIRREAYYLPRPIPLDRNKLTEANETYGDSIASFAKSFLGTGAYCARGECWDLASEALKYFDDHNYVPKPIPSISRTHGHLIYHGKASNQGRETIGQWRGGDDRIRRGDIVEWRKVRIASVGAFSSSGYSLLGDPDHTAVIVNETVPLVSVNDGFNMSPAELGTLTVVEQSVGQLPTQRDYNLQGMEEGEMWIYRPISMEAYLGINDLSPVKPDNIGTLRAVC